ncbi:EAL domain-containing protein [Arthrobacter sp. AL08]|uniref:putative bifunctional diguanylate cyclase/phosphodiesterase n=1 Tax=unclassified Arthrobacter TaxID=235627 RepID=UPI002499DB6C|nr:MULTISPECIES: bifunctional diguanylate cyclase/phosphodiesterase [unclassified Arthrobacter]MDI3239983.1 EAL domain-containing protein [Arthrobacter sp. AL05]MDI3275993.1 EAL domain-containing protein [Arthrobacter sp. AL08]
MLASNDDWRLEQLVAGIVVLSSGDLSNRLETSPARDGIDAVTTGINLLAEELQSMYDSLEVRVAERTALLEDAKADLRRVINTDELTGLASRSLLRETISRSALAAGESCRPPALILVDLDAFRLVNDSLGNAAGDSVLVEIARRLRSAADGQHLVARLSGDEFAVLVRDCDPESVLQLAARLVTATEAAIPAGGITVNVTTGTGVRFGESGLRADELIRDANIALHEAKKLGRNKLQVFSPAMHETAKARVHLVTEVRTAIAAGEFELHYQPIVDLRTGGVAGAEALIRWRHPSRGLLAPASFLASAEESGLTVEIGRWVLDQAIAQAGRWRTAPGLPEDFRIHVNLSAVELHHSDLAGYVQGLLAKYGVVPEHLAIEITETAIMSGGPEVSRTMEALTGLGIPLEIDDFGTGYSSISYLRTLPALHAKIDKSLIDGLVQDSQQEEFVAAILQLIHSAGLGAVAEGIEHREQAEKLKEMKCEFGQGYFFSRPLAVADMTALLAAGDLHCFASPAGSREGQGRRRADAPT